jgi:hypothetical protein
MELFNTLARKREKGFLVTCNTLNREGVDTVEKAETCRKRLHSNAKTYITFTVLAGLSLAMLVPSFALPILVGMGILLIYIITSTYRAKQFVSRYIREVLQTEQNTEQKAE